jgi:predicted DNA-binding WGR domain protein
MQKRPVYWEHTEDGHNKFWAANIQAEKDGTKKQNIYRLIRKWGLIGTSGQRMEQVFVTLSDAEHSLDRLIWEKEAKGYKAVF